LQSAFKYREDYISTTLLPTTPRYNLSTLQLVTTLLHYDMSVNSEIQLLILHLHLIH